MLFSSPLLQHYQDFVTVESTLMAHSLPIHLAVLDQMFFSWTFLGNQQFRVNFSPSLQYCQLAVVYLAYTQSPDAL